MSTQDRSARFAAVVLAHLDAGYNLARWITREPQSARDAVQDACLRAFVAFDQLSGPNVKSWFLAIVRNVCLDRLRDVRGRRLTEYDEDMHGEIAADRSVPNTPEDDAIRASDARWLHACIETLPRDYREVIVLREIEELSYKEISAIVDIPIGTVMSRLSRARDLLREKLLKVERRSSQ